MMDDHRALKEFALKTLSVFKIELSVRVIESKRKFKLNIKV